MMLLMVFLISGGKAANARSESMKLDQRQAYAVTMFKKHPEVFPLGRQQSILDGVISIGMTPFEAQMARGAFSYRVIADKSVWPQGSDPLKVMWAQSIKADNSEIWMTFKNTSQFLDGSGAPIRVHFRSGRVVSVEKIKE